MILSLCKLISLPFRLDIFIWRLISLVHSILSYRWLHLSNIRDLVHHTFQSSQTIFILVIFGSGHLDTFLIILFWKKKLQISIDVGIGLLELLEVERMSLSSCGWYIAWSNWVSFFFKSTSKLSFSNFHHLKKIFEAIFIFSLFDDR